MQTMHRTNPVLRITPLTILNDIEPALARYEHLGFQRVPSGDEGCTGMAAGDSSVILATTAFMSGDYDAIHVQRLVGQTAKYIHVSSVDLIAARLSAGAHVLQDVCTRGGTRELLVSDDNDVLIFAEVLD